MSITYLQTELLLEVLADLIKTQGTNIMAVGWVTLPIMQSMFKVLCCDINK